MKGQLKKQRNALKWEKGNEVFQNFMYENELEDNVKQLSPYHFRITTKSVIDVWPGVNKFYVRGMGASAVYADINELKQYIVKNR